MSWYWRMLARRPLLTQSVTTGLLFATGDITAQQLVDKRGADHDFTRTGRMCLYGTAVFGPVATKWFGFLQRRIVHPNKQAETLMRVAADQTGFAPVMIGVFLSSMAVLEGGLPRDKLDKSYAPALKANYYLWPAVQALNFSIVPQQHRLLFVNVIAIGWNTYLSFLNSKAADTLRVGEA